MRPWRQLAGQTLRRHPAATDAALLAGSQYAAAGLGFTTALLAARLLGPAEYGTAALLVAYPSLVWSIVAIKSISVTTRYLAVFQADQRHEDVRAVCKLGYAIDLFAALVAVTVVAVTAALAGTTLLSRLRGPLWPCLLYAASLPVLSLAGTSGAILTCWRRFRWVAVVHILEKILTLVVTFGLIRAGLGAAGVVVGTVLGQSAGALLMTAVASALLRAAGVGPWWRGSFSRVAGLRRELGSLLGWNYVVVTVGGLIAQGPLLLLGGVRGPEEAGFYRLASSITTAGGYLEGALSRVVYPRLAERTRSVPAAVLLAECRSWSLRAGAPAAVLLLAAIVALPVAVPPVLGREYAPLVAGTQVMLAGAAVSAVLFWLQPLYYASGRVGAWAGASGVHAGLVLLLSWMVAPSAGFGGIAKVLGVGKIAACLALAGMAAR